MAPQDLEHQQKTIAHIESIVRGFIDALNSGDSSPTSSAWQHISPSFVAFPDFPIETPSRAGSLEEYLPLWDHLKKIDPEHRTEILDIATRLKSNHAEVFLTTRAPSFFHKSVLVDHVGVLNFVYDENEAKWMCEKFTGFRGEMGDGDGLYGSEQTSQ